MPLRPRSNALTRSTGPNLAGDQFTGEIERGFLARMLRVEVRRFVLLVVHANHDSEKRGDYRHASGDFTAA